MVCIPLWEMRTRSAARPSSHGKRLRWFAAGTLQAARDTRLKTGNTQFRKSFSFLLRLGWRSLRRALASI